MWRTHSDNGIRKEWNYVAFARFLEGHVPQLTLLNCLEQRDQIINECP